MVAEEKGSRSDVTDFLKSVWDKRKRGIPISEEELRRAPTREEIAYLISRYPFIQLVNTGADFKAEAMLDFVFAGNGWVIFDYGDAITASPGEALFQWSGPFPGEAKEWGEQTGDTDEGEGGAVAMPGSGTIVKQAFDTTMEIMALIKAHEWAGVSFIEGTRDMAWAAWITAELHGFELEGFAATQEEEKKRIRLRRNLDLTALAKLKEAGPQPD